MNNFQQYKVYTTFSSINTFVCMVLCFLHAGVKGQDSVSHSINYKQVIELFEPIIFSSNAAALYRLPNIEFGTIALGIHQSQGNFKPTMTEGVSQHFNFFTEKYIFLENTVLYGNFSGNKKWDKNVSYTNVNDPYRGTPYLMLDTVGNDVYDREYYGLDGIMAHAFGRSVLGISVKYNIEIATQNRDPRAKNLTTKFDVKPSYLLQLNHFAVGANVGFSYYNEEIKAKNIEQNRVDNMYYLLGLRSGLTWRDDSFLRLYKRSGYNMEIQASNEWLMFLFGGDVFDETVDDGELGWSLERNFARLSGRQFYVKSIFSFSPYTNIHQVKLGAMWHSNSGTEIIQQKESVPPYDRFEWITIAENQTYSMQQHTYTFRYSNTRMKTVFLRNYSFGVEASYYFNREEYLVLNDEKSLGNLNVSAYFYKLFSWGNSMLSLQPKLTFKQNIQKQLQITDYSQDSNVELPDFYELIENNLVRPDFKYFTASYVSPELQITFEKEMKRSKNKVFVKGDLKWILPENSSMGYRQLLSGSVGFTL